MTVQIVLDLEADNLLDNVTKIWCICVKEPGRNKEITIYSDYTDKDYNQYKYELNKFSIELESGPIELIGHNIIAYDIPVMEKLLGIKFRDDYSNWLPGIKVIDTLVMSRLLYPDRPGGKAPHSLAEWGKRMGGEQKVEQEVWSSFDPNMITRCQSDVRLTEAVYKKLCEEVNAVR